MKHGLHTVLFRMKNGLVGMFHLKLRTGGHFRWGVFLPENEICSALSSLRFIGGGDQLIVDLSVDAEIRVKEKLEMEVDIVLAAELFQRLKVRQAAMFDVFIERQ